MRSITATISASLLSWLPQAASSACSLSDSDVSNAPPGICIKWDDIVLTDACRKCLVGQHWDELRERLGSPGHGRTATLAMSNWEAHQLQTAIVRTLLEEVLGYTTNVLYESLGSDRIPNVASGCADINLEIWNLETTRKQQFQLYAEELVADHMGTLGKEALYVTDSDVMPPVHYNFLQGDHWCADGGMNAFPPDGSTDLSDMLDSSGNLACPSEPTPWTNSSCINGRFYPPQCLPLDANGNSPTCREMYLVIPAWSAGWWEALVSNLGLNFSIAYLGSELAVAQKCLETGTADTAILYWWTPSVLHAVCPTMQFTVPRFSQECVNSYHYEPILSGVNCSPPDDQLQKIMRAKTHRRDEALRHVFDHYFFSNSDQTELLSSFVELGMSYEEVACEWLHRHESQWMTWLPIPEVISTTQTVDVSVLVLLALVVCVTVGAVIIGFMMLKRWKMMNQIQKLEDICKTRRAHMVDTEVMLHKLVGKAEAMITVLEPTGPSWLCGGRARAARELRNICAELRTCPPQQLWQVDVAEQLRSMSMDEGVKQHLRQQLSLLNDKKLSFKDRSATCSSSFSLLGVQHVSVASVRRWDFDVFEVSAEVAKNSLFVELFTSVADKSLDCLAPLNLTVDQLAETLRSAQASYAEPFRGVAVNYYHSAMHAADVFCSAAEMLRHVAWDALGLAVLDGYKSSASIASTLSAAEPVPLAPITRLAVALASLFHDYRHVGVQTHLLVTLRDPLAITYSDDSVMERMHLAEMFRLFEKHQCLVALHNVELRGLRRLMIPMVLSTDLGRGFVTVTEVKARYRLGLRDRDRLDSHASKDRVEIGIDNGNMDPKAGLQSVLNLVLECADMSHPGKALKLHKRWSYLLAKEFQRQGELEIQLGMPTSPLCGPIGDDQFAFAKSQKGFIDFIVAPKMTTLTMLCSMDSRANKCPPWSRQLESNCLFWVVEDMSFRATFKETDAETNAGFANSLCDDFVKGNTFEALHQEMAADELMVWAIFDVAPVSSLAEPLLSGDAARHLE